MKLLGEYILINKNKEDECDLIFTKQQNSQFGKGLVHSTGEAVSYLEGCEVMFENSAARTIDVQGEEFLLIKHSDVILTL